MFKCYQINYSVYIYMILLNFDRTSVVRKKYKHIAVKGRYSHWSMRYNWSASKRLQKNPN